MLVRDIAMATVRFLTNVATSRESPKPQVSSLLSPPWAGLRVGLVSAYIMHVHLEKAPLFTMSVSEDVP